MSASSCEYRRVSQPASCVSERYGTEWTEHLASDHHTTSNFGATQLDISLRHHCKAHAGHWAQWEAGYLFDAQHCFAMASCRSSRPLLGLNYGRCAGSLFCRISAPSASCPTLLSLKVLTVGLQRSCPSFLVDPHEATSPPLGKGCLTGFLIVHLRSEHDHAG